MTDTVESFTVLISLFFLCLRKIHPPCPPSQYILTVLEETIRDHMRPFNLSLFTDHRESES